MISFGIYGTTQPAATVVQRHRSELRATQDTDVEHGSITCLHDEGHDDGEQNVHLRARTQDVVFDTLERPELDVQS
jgi:hypothetical protein